MGGDSVLLSITSPLFGEVIFDEILSSILYSLLGFRIRYFPSSKGLVLHGGAHGEFVFAIREKRLQKRGDQWESTIKSYHNDLVGCAATGADIHDVTGSVNGFEFHHWRYPVITPHGVSFDCSHHGITSLLCLGCRVLRSRGRKTGRSSHRCIARAFSHGMLHAQGYPIKVAELDDREYHSKKSIAANANSIKADPFSLTFTDSDFAIVAMASVVRLLYISRNPAPYPKETLKKLIMFVTRQMR